mgnify:CR=1 FL=1
MTTATLRVYIALTSDANDTAPAWEEVTDDVQWGSCWWERGRDSELDFDGAGSAGFTLINRDRTYDPLYTSGPWYGYLTPGRQVKITSTYNATTVTQFVGFVLGFPQRFAAGGVHATVPVQCTTARGWLASGRMTSDPYADYLATLGTVGAWWRNADSTGAWSDMQNAGNTATLTTGEVSTTTSLGAGAQGTALASTGGVWRTWYTPTTGTTTLAFWMQSTTVGSSSSVWRLLFRGNTEWTTSAVGINSSGQLRAKSWDWNPGLYGDVTGVRNVCDGAPHFIVITSDPTNTSIYVDGVMDGTGTPGGGFIVAYIGGGDTAHLPYVGTIQDVAVLEAVPTAAQVATMYGLARGLLIESTTDRLHRLCDDAGWPSAWRSFSTAARGTVGAISYTGQDFNSAAQDVEASEQGRLYAAKDGTLTFLHRYAAQETSRCATSQATFTDTQTAGQIPYSSFGFDFDWFDVRNTIAVTTPDGQETATDPVSAATYGERGATINTVLSTPKQAHDMAVGLLYQWSTPQPRVPPMSVVLNACDTTAGGKLLGLELHDRVTVEMTPMDVGSALSFEQHVERIRWTTGDLWTAEIATSPVKPRFFMLGTDELASEYPIGY